MPFTFSHPAIVLPLLRKHSHRFSATGLIVGSMAPDFESFITLSDIKVMSHMWIGMFWFDLPLAMIIATVFHAIVRNPLIENLPKPLSERFWQYRGFHWFGYMRQHFWVVVVSLLIGIFSHLLWDSFTHLNVLYAASVTSHIKFLGFRLYKELQMACSAVGMVVILWVIYKLPRVRVPVRNAMKYQYWLILTLLMVLIGIIEVTIVLDHIEINPLLVIYIAISSFLASLIIVSVLYSLVLKREA